MLTRLKLILPVGFDLRNWVRVEYDTQKGEMVGKVYFNNLWWEGDRPPFADWMEVQVGRAQADEVDILGKLAPVAPEGLLRGEYRRLETGHAPGGWRWLVFALRYDMEIAEHEFSCIQPEVGGGSWKILTIAE